jgi:hypothetical protein
VRPSAGGAGEWLEPRSQVTRRMAEDVARLCRVLPIKHVAERCGLDWHTVKAIDKAWMLRTLPPLDMTGVTRLIMDEIAIHSGTGCSPTSGSCRCYPRGRSSSCSFSRAEPPARITSPPRSP